jgi:AraC-like DNA-binding protein
MSCIRRAAFAVVTADHEPAAFAQGAGILDNSVVDGAGLHYQEHAPLPELARHVRCIWTLEGVVDAGAGAPPPQVIVPDGCAELVLNVASVVTQVVDGARRPQPRRSLVGELRRPVALEQHGAIRLLGVRFAPSALRVFFREQACRLVDRVLDVDDLVQVEARTELSSLCSEESIARRVLRLQLWLRARLRESLVDDRIMRAAVVAIDARDGLVSIDNLAGALSLSRRQLERLFKEQMGIPPKAYAKLKRFRRASDLIAQGSSIVGAALEGGYVDQAHLTRAFREYAGTTPAAYLTRDNRLNELFTDK